MNSYKTFDKTRITAPTLSFSLLLLDLLPCVSERTNEIWRTISPPTPKFQQRSLRASLRVSEGESGRCEARSGAKDGSELLGLEGKEGWKDGGRESEG